MAQSTQRLMPTILLLTHARTASQMFERMLSQQIGMLYGKDWFVSARLPRRAVILAGPIDEVDPSITAELMKLMEKGNSEFLDFLEEAQSQGKIAFAHTQPHQMLSPKLVSDHAYDRWTGGDPGRWIVGPVSEEHTNPTVLADSTLLRSGTFPIINFRHPLLVCEGLFRAFRTLQTARATSGESILISIGGSLRWQRLVYEWYVEHGMPLGIKPILIEADDYLGPQKEVVMQKLCAQVPGLDADKVIYNWPKATAEEISGMTLEHKEVYRTLISSDGVMPGYDMRGRSMETEMPKWVESYGHDDANFLKSLVDKAMPDYEFLKAHKLTVD